MAEDLFEAVTQEQMEWASRLRKRSVPIEVIADHIGVPRAVFSRYLMFLEEQEDRCGQILGLLYKWRASEEKLYRRMLEETVAKSRNGRAWLLKRGFEHA